MSNRPGIDARTGTAQHGGSARLGAGAARAPARPRDGTAEPSRAGRGPPAPAGRRIEGRRDPRAVGGVRREDGAAAAAVEREGRHRQQHRALLRGGRRRSHRQVASRSEDQAAQLRLVHGAGRVVPGGRAAGALVRRRRGRYQQLQVVQRHPGPRGRRQGDRGRGADPRRSDPVAGFPGLGSRARRARSARALRRRRVLLPDSRSARRGAGRATSPRASSTRSSRTTGRKRIGGWRRGRCWSTSAWSACGSVR